MTYDDDVSPREETWGMACSAQEAFPSPAGELLISLEGAEANLTGLLSALRGIAVGSPTASFEDLRAVFERGDVASRQDDTLLVNAEWALKGFAVILAGWIETALYQVFRECGRNLARNARWDKYVELYAQVAGQELDKVPGYEAHVWKVRTLANSFKHNDGVATAGDAAILGVAEGGKVVYLLQDWDAHISGMVQFCRAAVATMPPLHEPCECVQIAMEDGSTLVCPMVQLQDGTRVPIPMTRRDPESSA